jgi:hypothetical protein
MNVILPNCKVKEKKEKRKQSINHSNQLLKHLIDYELSYQFEKKK